MAEKRHGRAQIQRIHLTVVALVIVCTVMFVSTAFIKVVA